MLGHCYYKGPRLEYVAVGHCAVVTLLLIAPITEASSLIEVPWRYQSSGAINSEVLTLERIAMGDVYDVSEFNFAPRAFQSNSKDA